MIRAVEARRGSGRVAGDVHVEAEVRRVRARRPVGAEVCFADVDRAVAGFLQEARQRHVFFLKTVDVPFRRAECRVFDARVLVLVERPKRDVGSRRAHAGHDARPRGRTHGRRSVGVREPHAFSGEPFDVGRSVALVEWRRLCVEWNAEILPAEIVDEKEKDVGVLTLLPQSVLRQECHQEPGGNAHGAMLARRQRSPVHAR